MFREAHAAACRSPRPAAWALLLLLAAGLLPACAHEKANGRPWVRHLRFDGVKHVDAKDLKSKIAVEQTSIWFFMPKKFLDPLALQLDTKRIESYYAAHGYFDAHVLSTAVSPRPKASVDVTITLQEGVATHIESVAVEGLEPLGTAAQPILKNVDLHPGDVFNEDRFISESDEIRGRLHVLGYAWAKDMPSAVVNRDAATAKIHIVVSPGPMTYLGTIEIKGAVKVSSKRLLRHSMLSTGDRFSPAALEAARSRLYNTGLFTSIKLEKKRDPNHPDRANLVFEVIEGKTRELRLGVGFGLDAERMEVRARAIFTKLNFLGGLRTLTFRIEPAYVALPTFWNIERQGPAVTADVTLTQPDLFFRNDTLKFTVGYDLGIDYAYQDHGPRTSLGYSHTFLHDRLSLGLSYNFQVLLFFNTDPTILDNPAQARALFGYTDPYRVGWWQQDLSFDGRDKPLETHKGGYFALHLEEGGEYAGGAFEYEKIQPDLRGYAPLGSRVVLAARAQGGQIFSQGSLGSPITRRFYMGGPDSHRGFNYNRLSLQAPSGLPGVAPIPIGGDQMVLGQLEVRVNIVKLLGYWLEAAAFVDAGDVAAPTLHNGSNIMLTCPDGQPVHTSSSVDFTKLHYATGAGLRYKTIVGTIRLDVGVRLNRLAACEADHTPNPDPGSRVAVHISIGEPF